MTPWVVISSPESIFAYSTEVPQTILTNRQYIRAVISFITAS